MDIDELDRDVEMTPQEQASAIMQGFVAGINGVLNIFRPFHHEDDTDSDSIIHVIGSDDSDVESDDSDDDLHPISVMIDGEEANLEDAEASDWETDDDEGAANLLIDLASSDLDDSEGNNDQFDTADES